MRTGRTGRRTGFRRGVWLPLALLALAGASARAEREQEPLPPMIFFAQPDQVTAREIDRLVENSFAALDRVASARDLLLRGYGLWCVPRLAEELRAASNETSCWNAALTAYALRDRLGGAPEAWPLLPPLLRLLETGDDPYRRAFAALALGSFHGPGAVPPPRAHPDPLLVVSPEREAAAALERALAAMGSALHDPHPHVRVAAALALAKAGGPEAARLLREETRTVEAVMEPLLAVLVARGLTPREADEADFVQALADVDRRVRRAAALAIALQALSDDPPPWPRPAQALRRALTSADIRPDLEDGAETVFARGVLAATGLATEEWRAVFDIAVHASTKDQSVLAAAQCLLFCEEPWLRAAALERMRSGVTLDERILAVFLLRLASRGEQDGAARAVEVVDLCYDWLRNPSRGSRGSERWDVREYAALGLLRALAAGRLVGEARAPALEALRVGAKRGLREGPFRAELERLLDAEWRRLVEDEHHRVPGARLAALEAAVSDPHGLLSRDLRDVVVLRLNTYVPLLFGVDAIRPGTPGQPSRTEMPRRFLKAALDPYPYFSRLDLLTDRGVRRPPGLLAGEADDTVDER